MNPFRPSRRSNPCAICGGTKPKCKTKITRFDLPSGYLEAAQYYCMGLRGQVTGFKYTGETEDSRWSKYIDEATSNALSQAWKRNYRPTIPKARKFSYLRKPKVYSHLLPIAERDREIKRLLSQLTLSSKHHKDLVARGLDDTSIARSQYKSLTYRQPLTAKISDRLAGVAPGGMHLNNRYTGILIPIVDCQNRYLGWQCRLDNRYEDLFESKYLWPNSGKYSAHLQEYEELPLCYGKPAGEIESSYIGLTEGVGFKTRICAEKMQQIVIGASGGNFVSSPQLLKVYLAEASKITEKKKILLYPDAGAVCNWHVIIQYHKVFTWLNAAKYQVRFAWWSQITKTEPDIDEYHGLFDIITPHQFFTIAQKYLKYQKIQNYAINLRSLSNRQ